MEQTDTDFRPDADFRPRFSPDVRLQETRPVRGMQEPGRLNFQFAKKGRLLVGICERRPRRLR